MALMKQQIISETLWDLKCPYSMEPIYITIHNTANNASAAQEVAYLEKNTASTSCHIFVDETEAIQCLPLDRNAWHAGDGSNGTGNRCSIGVEICRSADYKTDRHHLAMLNAAEIVRQLMREYKIQLDHVVQHNHWSGKDCPHRIRSEGTWQTFLSLCAVSDKEEGDEFMEFKEGYQKVSWQGQIVHVYKRKSNQDIGLMSAGGDRVLKTINNIDDDHIHYCKVNCSYFVMSGSEKGTVCGRQQGFTVDGRPDQTQWLDVVVTRDNKLVAGDLASWEYPGEEVKVGYSPAVILLLDGQEVTMISSEAGQAKYTNANTQTLHMRDANGVDVFAVVSGNLNGKSCRQFAKAYGMVYCAMLDSGGSSQMIVDGVKKVYTGRALPNVLTFYKAEDHQTDPEPTPEPTGDQFIVVDSVGMRVREKLAFSSGKATGKQLKLVPVGGKAKLIKFIPGIQPDGYQWVESEYDGCRGYSQYDSKCYWIEEDGELEEETNAGNKN